MFEGPCQFLGASNPLRAFPCGLTRHDLICSVRRRTFGRRAHTDGFRARNRASGGGLQRTHVETMSTFEIDLDDFSGEPLDVDLQPSREEPDALFEDFEDEYRVDDPDSFQVELTATLDGRTVILSGEVIGTFVYTCGRCLTERTTDVRSRIDLKVLSREEWEESYTGEEEIALEADDLDTDYYEGESVDLRPFVRDAFMMELPQWPQCPEEFRQECDAAYEEHVGDETIEQMEHNSVDLRWWPLREIDLEEDEESDETQANSNDKN